MNICIESNQEFGIFSKIAQAFRNKITEVNDMVDEQKPCSTRILMCVLMSFLNYLQIPHNNRNTQMRFTCLPLSSW